MLYRSRKVLFLCHAHYNVPLLLCFRQPNMIATHIRQFIHSVLLSFMPFSSTKRCYYDKLGFWGIIGTKMERRAGLLITTKSGFITKPTNRWINAAVLGPAVAKPCSDYACFGERLSGAAVRKIPICRSRLHCHVPCVMANCERLQGHLRRCDTLDRRTAAMLLRHVGYDRCSSAMTAVARKRRLVTFEISITVLSNR